MLQLFLWMLLLFAIVLMYEFYLSLPLVSVDVHISGQASTHLPRITFPLFKEREMCSL